MRDSKAHKDIYVRFYNEKNLGDDLFIRILTDRYPDTFYIGDNNNQRLLSIDNLRLARGGRLISSIDKVIRKTTGYKDFIGLRGINRFDAYVYIGGSLFMETNGVKPWNQELRFYERLKRPYFILGSNVGPVVSDEFVDVLSRIFEKSRDVCFRDLESYKQFKNIPSVRVATDIVFSIKSERERIFEDKVAVFSIIDGDSKFHSSLRSKYETEMVNLIKSAINSSHRVILMSFCKKEGDEVAINRILEGIDESSKKIISTYFYDGNVDEALDIIASSEIVVATRFHAAILGLVFNKRVLPVAYSAKTLNILKDISFDGDIININDIHEFDGTNYDFSNVKLNDVDSQRLLAQKQFAELDKFLRAGV